MYQAHKDLTESNEAITADIIKNRFLGKEEKSRTLLQAIKDHNQKMEALIDNGYAIGTLNRFEVLERHITSFLQERHKIADLSVKK